MKSVTKMFFAAALAVGAGMPPAAAFSAPMSVPAPTIQKQSEIQNARWVRRCNANRCRNVWVGPRRAGPRVVIRPAPRVVIRPAPRVVVRPGVVVRPAGGNHVRWCSNRYRSYDARSNTFIAYGGDVRRCVSPYRR
jgi:hypothetical protein